MKIHLNALELEILYIFIYSNKNWTWTRTTLCNSLNDIGFNVNYDDVKHALESLAVNNIIICRWKKITSKKGYDINVFIPVFQSGCHPSLIQSALLTGELTLPPRPSTLSKKPKGLRKLLLIKGGYENEH